MRPDTLRVAALFAVLWSSVVVSGGCKTAATPPLRVTVNVVSSRGAPVEGAEILLHGQVLGRSAADGRAVVEIAGGHEGDSFPLDVHCPGALRSPAEPLVVRQLAIAGGNVEHTAKCEETRRILTVVVRAENGPNLPILRLDHEIGRTDGSGAATIRIDCDVHERVELVLGTKGVPEMADAHPQDPPAVFPPEETDAIHEFSVTFTKDAKRKPQKAAPKGPQVF